MSTARDVLDEVIVRALAAQQDYADNIMQSDRPLAEPKSEDVVTEILAALAAAGLAVVPARCQVTGNPFGTDTWMIGRSCPCAVCQAMLSSAPAP